MFSFVKIKLKKSMSSINKIQTSRYQEVTFQIFSKFSRESKDFLEDRGLGYLFTQCSYKKDSLQGEINHLRVNMLRLETAKDNLWKDRLIAIGKVGLIIATVAGVTASVAFGGLVGIIVGGLIGLIIYVGISLLIMDSSADKIDELEKLLPNYKAPWYSSEHGVDFDPRLFPTILGMNIVLPLFDAVTRKSRINRISREINLILNEKTAQLNSDLIEKLKQELKILKKQSTKVENKEKVFKEIKAARSQLKALSSQLGNDLKLIQEKT